jgi:glycosyltransferase involved in cell wall biosynthesis
MDLLKANPPPGVSYTVTGGFHHGAPGVASSRMWEIALNRLVRPRTIPDIGFRALRVRDRFDLVHVHAHPVKLFGLGDVPLVMSEGSSSAVYLGDYLGWDEHRLKSGYARARRIYRRLAINDRLLTMERVDRAYVFSRWARDVNVRWGADPAKLDVVPPGFPMPPDRRPRNSDAVTFLFIGTDFERKGGFDLVEAFARVNEAHPETRLVLAGSHPNESNPDRETHSWVSDRRRARVLDRLAELRQRGVVRTFGPVARSVVHDTLYPEADVFVLPTLAEGFGFTNVEAMAHGLAVISTTLGPIPEVVHEDETGHLVPPGDVEALAVAMSRLASGPDRARVMGTQGRVRFERTYTINRFRERLAGVYARAAASRCRAS